MAKVIPIVDEMPANLCMAPFTYITLDSARNVSPCPALGGSLWNFEDQSLLEIWKNQTLSDFREVMLENKKHTEACHRCWEEEDVGMLSERTMLWNPEKDPTGTTTNILETSETPHEILSTESWKKGPKQVVIKISNICNLRCRSCNSADSVTLSVEGKYFAEHYGYKNNFWLLDTKSRMFTDEQIDEIADFVSNAVRIEFYGGEPLLDKQLPKLLQKLVDKGVARNIKLNISTNATHQMSESLIETLSHFSHLNLNLSLDGWGRHFTYLRHPGKWPETYDNIRWFLTLRDSGRVPMTVLAAVTVTSMNVFYLPELITRLKIHLGLPVFLILSYHPYYFSTRHIPTNIAEPIAQKLEAFDMHDLSPIANMLREPADPELWKQFQAWTKMIDEYRGESFAKTFPEYYNLIKSIDPEFSV